MKFLIEFRAKNGWSIEVKQREIGLREVQAIRDYLGVNLPLKKIQGWVDYLHKNPVIVVSENQAKLANRANGLFEHCNRITVTGFRGFLNPFIQQGVGYSSNEKTGEIEEACIFPDFWEEAVIEEWFCLGCPLEWPVEEDE